MVGGKLCLHIRYAAFCPSCGNPLTFEILGSHTDQNDVLTVEMYGQCGKVECMRKWLLFFDCDPTSTFGVSSYQCSNDDRDMSYLE
jgi:hypothetical protein